jgi:hypothetical protein
MTAQDLQIYFYWSLRSTIGQKPAEVDAFLLQNLQVIKDTAQKLMSIVKYVEKPLYRGIILKNKVQEIKPDERYNYLSFTENLNLAKHFADPTETGFGLGPTMKTKDYLGEYGYVIEYTPKKSEILFHHDFAKFLPYVENMVSLGINEIKILEQKEIQILQPQEPFTNILLFDKNDPEYKPLKRPW